MKKNQRSKVGMLFLLVVLVLAAVVWMMQHNRKGNADGIKTAAKPSMNAIVVIRLWGASDFLKGEESPGIQMINDFNQQYKGSIYVDARYFPWDEYSRVLQKAMDSDQMPDIFITPRDTNIHSFVRGEQVRFIDDLVSPEWKKQFYDGSFAEGVNVIEGKTYSWPVTGPELETMLYYNKDVLKNAGLNPDAPPRTWNEFREMAATVTKTSNGKSFGLIIGGAESPLLQYLVGGLSGTVSPEVRTGFNFRTGKFAYDSPEWQQAIGFLLTLKQDKTIHPASYVSKFVEADALFAHKEAAFMIDGRWKQWILKRDYPEAQIGFAQLPSPEGEHSYYGYLPATSRNTYLISAKTMHPEAVGIFIEKGFASPLFYKRFLHQGVALTPFPALNDNKMLYPYPEFEKFVKLHFDLMRIRPDPVIRNANTAKVMQVIGDLTSPTEANPSLGNVLQFIINGQTINVGESLKQLTGKMNLELEKAVTKVKSEGNEVKLGDFSFPNWNPSQNFTEQDYLNVDKNDK